MMKKLLAMLLLLLMAFPVLAEEKDNRYDAIGDCGFDENTLLPVKRDGLWGYVNLQGELVIPCVWTAAREFYDGYAIVEDRCMYGVIDTTGAEVEPCVWERLEYQGDGWFEGRKTVTFNLTEGIETD